MNFITTATVIPLADGTYIAGVKRPTTLKPVTKYLQYKLIGKEITLNGDDKKYIVKEVERLNITDLALSLTELKRDPK